MSYPTPDDAARIQDFQNRKRPYDQERDNEAALFAFEVERVADEGGIISGVQAADLDWWFNFS